MTPLWPEPQGGMLLFLVWHFFPAMLLNLVLYLGVLYFGQPSLLPLDLRFRSGRERWVGDGRGFSSFLWGLGVIGFCALVQGRGDDLVSVVAGAQMGMIALSLVKRRLGLPRGTAFRPWEHVDFALGAMLFGVAEGRLSIGAGVLGVLLCGGIHWGLGGAIKVGVGWLLSRRKVGASRDQNLAG